MQETERITPEEMLETLFRVKRLYRFFKNSKTPIYLIARKNEKSQLLYRFIREYSTIITAYERAERKVAKKYDYLPKSAIERIFTKIKNKAHELRLRFRLNKKPKSDCYHSCLRCKYFNSCRSEVEADYDK